ncbi:hypothetical protein K1719_036386 [Acacia pycnantha]|nr:hypothetical protein K1719_036386 [Acacia pycnantha]
MLTYGEISSEIHSRRFFVCQGKWDHKIPIGLFYWTLETSKVKAIDEEMRTGFLGIGFHQSGDSKTYL